MDSNNYSWNKTLKFSWGHIIAFIALIFISYVTYMGDFYANGGNFQLAAIKVFIIDVVLLLVFIGAQVLKGTDSKFNRSIIIERILIIISPFVFIGCMLPYNHFWNVFSERSNIESQFTSSITNSKQLFEDYDSYAKQRIDDYSKRLSEIIKNRETNVEAYKQAGFTTSNDLIAKENYVHTLSLQLISQNTDSLRTQALNWIENANQGASVWNAFLVGNVDKISYAINSWYKTLSAVSEKRMTNESGNVQNFNESNNSFQEAVDGLNQLKNIYIKASGYSSISIISAIILFLMLLFPYLLQKRNTRANGLYYLFPHKEHKLVQNNDITDINSTSVNENSSSGEKNNDLYDGAF